MSRDGAGPAATAEPPPRWLARRAVERIVARLSLVESRGEDGGPQLRLASGNDAVSVAGAVRLWRGAPLQQVVHCSLTVDDGAVESHMVYAFCPPDSPVPHFALDTAAASGSCGYHVDLIPRVDLAAHLEYVRFCYDLLTDTALEANRCEGVAAAALSPLQYTLTSPWTLVQRATPAAFGRVGEIVDEYLDHWFALLEDGLPVHVIDEIDLTALAERDRRLRRSLFDPAVDPTWERVTDLVGADTTDRIRAVLERRGDAAADQPPRV